MIIGMVVFTVAFEIAISINPYISSLFLLEDRCNVMLRDTCELTNDIIGVSNIQAKIIEKCSNFTLPLIGELNCDKLN